MKALPKRSESHATCASACRGSASAAPTGARGVSQGFWSAEVDRIRARLAPQRSWLDAVEFAQHGQASPQLQLLPHPPKSLLTPIASMVPMVFTMQMDQRSVTDIPRPDATGTRSPNCTLADEDRSRAGAWRPPTSMRSSDRLCSFPFVSFLVKQSSDVGDPMDEAMHPEATRHCRIGANALQNFLTQCDLLALLCLRQCDQIEHVRSALVFIMPRFPLGWPRICLKTRTHDRSLISSWWS